MQYPNILDGPIATEILAFFEENPVNKILSFVGFDLLTFDGITDEAASVIAGCNRVTDQLHSLYVEDIPCHAT